MCVGLSGIVSFRHLFNIALAVICLICYAQPLQYLFRTSGDYCIGGKLHKCDRRNVREDCRQPAPY